MTANSVQLVHSAALRFMRMQLRRGGLAAAYAKLSDADAAHLFARTTEPDFAGLVLKETDYKTWEELGDAVVDSRWEKMRGTAKWVMFLHVPSNQLRDRSVRRP